MAMQKDTDTLSEEVLAALLSTTRPVEPPAALKAKVMARAGVSMPVQQNITIRDHAGWMELTPLLSMKLLFVDERADSVSFLLKGKPGAAVPPHTHSRYEECLVLEGDVQVGDYMELGPGDYHVAGQGHDHPVLSTRNGTLVYLRTAIRDCPIPLR